jgi:hypothetical protein
MFETVMKTIISLVVSGLFGYLIGRIKDYKKKLKENKEEANMLKVAMMTMLQSNLTNTYFAYEKMKEIPDYIYRNWLNSLAIYEKLGGDDYIHTIAEKMKKWDFVKTDILK